MHTTANQQWQRRMQYTNGFVVVILCWVLISGPGEAFHPPVSYQHRTSTSVLPGVSSISTVSRYQHALKVNHRHTRDRHDSIQSTLQTLQSAPHKDWDGDDIRWTTQMRRRFQRSFMDTGIRAQPVRTILVLLNLCVFIAQVVQTTHAIRLKYPEYWPRQSLAMIWDATWGSATPGSLTTRLAHSAARSRLQPYRYITAGFLHGGLLHFVLNMDALLRVPSWLETGLGPSLFATAYLVSIVTGNLAHTWATQHTTPYTWIVGASGGICGLYGLVVSALWKLGNRRAAGQVIRSLFLLCLYGLLMPSVSNAAHVGGVVGGFLVGLLCGPSYTKSYMARRKNSLEVDTMPREYRLVMGFGTKPIRGWIPLPVLWLIMVGAPCLLYPPVRATPQHIQSLFRNL
jgi:membrane associated rhomboid family serine protease